MSNCGAKELKEWMWPLLEQAVQFHCQFLFRATKCFQHRLNHALAAGIKIDALLSPFRPIPWLQDAIFNLLVFVRQSPDAVMGQQIQWHALHRDAADTSINMLEDRLPSDRTKPVLRLNFDFKVARNIVQDRIGKPNPS